MDKPFSPGNPDWTESVHIIDLDTVPLLFRGRADTDGEAFITISNSFWILKKNVLECVLEKIIIIISTIVLWIALLPIQPWRESSEISYTSMENRCYIKNITKGVNYHACITG